MHKNWKSLIIQITLSGNSQHWPNQFYQKLWLSLAFLAPDFWSLLVFLHLIKLISDSKPSVILFSQIMFSPILISNTFHYAAYCLEQILGHLPLIPQIIQDKKARHAGQCWKSRNKLNSMFYGLLHMDTPVLVNQQKFTFISSLQTPDAI